MLKGKTALVTGSTSGIGQGVARAFAAQGCNIMLNGFGDADEIEAARAAMEKEFSVKVAYHGADLTDVAQIEDLLQTAADTFGTVDILVNNAGIQHVAPIEDFPVEKYDKIIALNMNASWHTMRLAVPGMKKAGWGRIINIASAHALIASPFKSAYVTAKHGVAGMTKTVALEVAQHGITVNAICPGYVWTPLVEAQIPDTARSRGISEEAVINDVLLLNQPTKAFTTIEQVGGMAVFLAGPAADNITGSLQSMDGGWSAQ
ncbi:3-hydroxybutyrate dehydrogenase [Granulosicoccaceae sp. 1_MG-2023]|nr:3-hydroxybutyrate dehydrogenase [Granulosicoccaceae sp. 1_MG-2023]